MEKKPEMKALRDEDLDRVTGGVGFIGDPDDVQWIREESYDANLPRETSAWYGISNPKPQKK